MTIKLTTQIEKAVATEAIRPVLHGVFFDVECGRAVAVDGFIGAIVPITAGENDENGIVDIDVIKMARKGKQPLHASIEGKHVSFIKNGTRFTAELVDGDYPNVDKIIPKFKGGDKGTVTIALNARLLLRLQEALGAKHGVRLTFKADPADHDGHAILVEPIGSDVEGAIGALMPMSISHKYGGK